MGVEDWYAVFLIDQYDMHSSVTQIMYDMSLGLAVGFILMGIVLAGFLLYNTRIYLEKERKNKEQLRLAMEAAKQASQAKSEFLSRMSHDIRTPLNGIIGMTDMAEAKADDKPALMECLRKIHSASRHLLTLVNEVLDIARIESGKISVNETQIDLHESMAVVHDIIESRALSRNQTYQTDFSGIIHPLVITDDNLLTQILRQEMGFDGVAVADYSAVSNVHHTQKLYETEAEAGLACLSAGMDVELPDTVCFNEEMKAMFAQGKADMALLDQAVRRVLRAKFRMGLFEHPFALTGSALSEMVHHPEDELITLQSALESLVLLKNDNHVLPVGKNVRKIALIGPHADNARHFFGGYTHLSMVEAIHAVMNSLAGVDASNTERKPMLTVPGTQVQSDETEEFAQIGRQIKPDCPSLLAKLTSSLPDAEITYAYGYPIAGADESHFAEALQAAAGADLVILTLGGKHGSGSVATMGEGVDATDINLPRCQDAFIRAAANLHKPMIGIHFGGRPISSDAADECLDAILEAWNPSEMGAEALTRVLTGETAPSGRMPVTTARSAGQIPVYYNHPNGSSWHQGDSIGFQEYVDMPHRPRYYFGQGLSYTTFAYDGLRIDKEEVGPREEITVSCQVTNTGSRAGTEVVQLYLRDEQACMVRPVQELVGFARVALEPGESRQVCFTFRPDRMAFLNREMRWLVEKGMIGVRIGASSEDIRLRGAFRIRESAIIQGRERCFYAKTDIF